MSAEHDRSVHAQKPANDPGTSLSGSQTAAAYGEGAADTFAAIEAEGARECWHLARRTAQAVFTDPAVVTPRRMALLGEQGLARFVDDVRSAARFLIRRERERRAADPDRDATSPDQTAAGTVGPDPDSAPVPLPLRRPAAFRMAETSPPRSIRSAFLGRLRSSESIRRFAVDVLTWTGLPAVVLVGVFAAYRFFRLPWF